MRWPKKIACVLVLALAGGGSCGAYAAVREESEEQARAADDLFLRRLEDRQRRFAESERLKVAAIVQKSREEEAARLAEVKDREAQVKRERELAQQKSREEEAARLAESKQREDREARDRDAERQRQIVEASKPAEIPNPADEPKPADSTPQPREQVALLQPGDQAERPSFPSLPIIVPPAVALPAVAPTAAPDATTIRAAQAEMRRLGCYAGKPNGEFDSATQKASGRARELLKVNSIGPGIDDLLPALKDRKQRLCPLDKPNTQQAARPPREAPEPKPAARPERPERPRQAARPPAEDPPPRRAAPAPRPAPRAVERPAPRPAPAAPAPAPGQKPRTFIF